MNRRQIRKLLKIYAGLEGKFVNIENLKEELPRNTYRKIVKQLKQQHNKANDALEKTEVDEACTTDQNGGLLVSELCLEKSLKNIEW